MMSRIVDSRRDIPDAPYYVLANDNFMSGWGPAKGKINTVILPCESYEEVRWVEDYASSRSEMSYVRIAGEKPRLRAGRLYSLLTRENASAWYPKNRGA